MKRKQRSAALTVFVTIVLFFATLSRSFAAGCTPGVNCLVSGGIPPLTAPAAGEPNGALAQGLFTYTKTDLALPGPMPIEITRTYRSEDRSVSGGAFNVRSFGKGTMLNYDIY